MRASVRLPVVRAAVYCMVFGNAHRELCHHAVQQLGDGVAAMQTEARETEARSVHCQTAPGGSMFKLFTAMESLVTASGFFGSKATPGIHNLRASLLTLTFRMYAHAVIPPHARTINTHRARNSPTPKSQPQNHIRATAAHLVPQRHAAFATHHWLLSVPCCNVC